MGLVRLDWLHLYKYHLGGSVVYSVSYFDISSFILNILRLNEGFSFGMKGWLVVWHYLVHVTVKGGPLFFSLWFFSYVIFLYLTGRLVLWHIGVFGYFLLLVCRCAFFLSFPFVRMPFKGQASFILFLYFRSLAGWIRLVERGKKKTFLCVIFYCLL